MKTDKYELGEGNELTIKILYDPEDPGMWYNVKINKLNGDEETEEWLKENNAAVLKYMIETAAKQDKSFIGRNDWPKGVNGGAKAYKQIRFMRRIDDFILMCTTDVTPGLIYRTTCNSDSITTVAPDAIRKLNSPHNLYLRTIDAVRHDNGYFFAAAGDSGEKHIIEIWNESLSTVIYPEYERGISTLCMSMFAGRYYLFSASYDGTISGYELNSDEESITFRPICTCHHSDQVLHIQASGNKLYVSLLSGKVFAWNIRDILGECERQFSENEAALLFHTITGLNICNVDFSLSNTDDWDEAFSSIVRYYEYTE